MGGSHSHHWEERQNYALHYPNYAFKNYVYQSIIYICDMQINRLSIDIYSQLNSHYTEDHTQIIYVKMLSHLEMQIKAIMKHHHPPIRMAKLKQTNIKNLTIPPFGEVWSYWCLHCW